MLPLSGNQHQAQPRQENATVEDSHSRGQVQRNATYVRIAALLEVVADVGRLLGTRVVCESSQGRHPFVLLSWRQKLPKQGDRLNGVDKEETRNTMIEETQDKAAGEGDQCHRGKEHFQVRAVP